MKYYAKPLNRLIGELSRLPGIGGKTAQRLAFHILSMEDREAFALADAIREAKQTMKYCSVCGNLTDEDPCSICRDESRDRTVICVVESPKDVIAMEKIREFKGLYHVLHGAISPMDGIGPEDIGCAALHGTGTPANDAMESRLMHDLLPDVPAFAPKYFTGHTLSAAGAMGVMLSALVIEDEIPIPALPYAAEDIDPELPRFSLVTERGRRPKGRYALADSFAFGGNNAAVIIGTNGK